MVLVMYFILFSVLNDFVFVLHTAIPCSHPFLINKPSLNAIIRIPNLYHNLVMHESISFVAVDCALVLNA